MKIEGLKNDVQAYMLTKMWKCKNLEQIQKWQSTLSPTMKKESEALYNLMIIEAIDEDTKRMGEFPQVKKVLQNIV